MYARFANLPPPERSNKKGDVGSSCDDPPPEAERASMSGKARATCTEKESVSDPKKDGDVSGWPHRPRPGRTLDQRQGFSRRGWTLQQGWQPRKKRRVSDP